MNLDIKQFEKALKKDSSSQIESQRDRATNKRILVVNDSKLKILGNEAL